MKKILSKLVTTDYRINFLLLLVLFVSMLMISPKWNITFLSFIFIFINLRYFRNVKTWKAALFTLFITISASFIANQGVMPFPAPVMLIIIFFLGVVRLIPFVLDKLLYKKVPGPLSIFIFPSAALCVESFIANGPNGTFGNIAYNLVDFKVLMQLTSVTGIWGIAFLIYLFASVFNHLLENFENSRIIRFYSISYLTLFSIILIFGFIRLHISPKSFKNVDTLKVGSVTTENMNWSIAVHKVVTGEILSFPKRIDQTSPQLMKFQSSLNEFISDHNNPKFDSVYVALEEYYDEIFQNSQKAVNNGAKIILLSESEIITFYDREDKIIKRAKEFAFKNKIYFFFSMGTIYPEKMKNETPFIGNKILTIDPNGDIIDTYYKNVPVKDVDPSIPGDGIIDVIETPLGNFSPIICYDADFPVMMRQTGRNNTEVVLVATGDWYSITPYHAKIGLVRSIENGVSMLKTTSYGLSVATDPFGNILAEDNFFEDDIHIMIADIPILKLNTFYSKAGDFLINLSYIYLVFIFIYLLVSRIVKK